MTTCVLLPLPESFYFILLCTYVDSPRMSVVPLDGIGVETAAFCDTFVVKGPMAYSTLECTFRFLRVLSCAWSIELDWSRRISSLISTTHFAQLASIFVSWLDRSCGVSMSCSRGLDCSRRALRSSRLLFAHLAFFGFWFLFRGLTGAAGCAPGGDGNDGALPRPLSRPGGNIRVHRTVRRGQCLPVQADGQGGGEGGAKAGSKEIGGTYIIVISFEIRLYML